MGHQSLSLLSGRTGLDSSRVNMHKRDLWLGLGAIAGSFAGQLIRGAFGKRKAPADAKHKKSGIVRASIGGPGSVMAATGLARSAADQLSLDPEDPRVQAAVGFAVGLGLNLLAGPLRRVLPL